MSVLEPPPLHTSPLESVSWVWRFREFTLLLILAVLWGAMAIYTPVFCTWDNAHAILLNMSFDFIVAVGMTILMVSGGFDLSVGSITAMCGAISVVAMERWGFPIPVAIVVGLSTGAVIGLVNGLIIGKIGINPFITTLGMMGIVRGALTVLLDGKNIAVSVPSEADIAAGLPVVDHSAFNALGKAEVLGVQAPVLYALLLLILGDVLLRKNRFLRQNYYIGGNEKAALISGIPVNWIKLFNYGLIGLLAGIAGIAGSARLGNASVNANNGMELKVILAVILGGASLQGGEGTVIGTFLGMLLMGTLITALPLLGVNPNWNPLVTGSILLIVVIIDTLTRSKSGKIR